MKARDKEQEINSTDLYLSNAKMILTNGLTHRDDFVFFIGGPIWNLIYFVLSPLTVGVGAAIKTAIDVNTRMPLTNHEMEILNTNLKNLDEHRLNKLVQWIIRTTAQSVPSKKLQRHIKSSYGWHPSAEYIRVRILDYVNDRENIGTHVQNVIYRAAGILVKPPTIEKLTEGILYLIMILGMENQKLLNLNMDLWIKIIDQIAPFTEKEFHQAFFFTSRKYLRAQLAAYDGEHNEHARSLEKHVFSIPDRENLKVLVNHQCEILQGNNPYPLEEQNKKFKMELKNKTIDRYNHIISFWKRALPQDGSTKEIKKPDMNQPRIAR
jgi:hypothetical protein